MENNNIWNDAFKKENMIWGIEPNNIAKTIEKIFLENGIKIILVIGQVMEETQNIFLIKIILLMELNIKRRQ